ncbi:MAG: hypothetical protein JWM47_1118, partial [Acidimicrobiales bacterium]|nr:hypothetical protein [Acidimicrobiales bacterium]
GPPRLFGGRSSAPAAPTEPAASTAPTAGGQPPLARRSIPGASAPLPAPAPSARPASPAPPVPAVADAAAPAVTGAGLTRRVPRQGPGGGSARAIPGSDAERGVGATRRSPDEVRSLLSSYRDGQQRARSEEPVSAGISDERENHE